MVKVYAERPWRFTRQLIADASLAAWTILWIWAAITLYGFVSRLAAPGAKLESSGEQLSANLADAQQKAGSVPLIGDKLSAPFEAASNAAKGIADAGRSQQETVGDLATVLAWATGLLPVILALALWIPFRFQWMRAATAAVKVRKRPGGAELLALRALAKAPLRRLADLDDDVVTGWRDGDPSCIDVLARLELRSLGLRTKKLK